MPKSSTFDPAKLPDLTGYVVLVTGGHSGLGLATTKVLALKNAKVYIASRSISKAEAAARGIKEENANAKVELIEMDLADLESVKRGAEEFLRFGKLSTHAQKCNKLTEIANRKESKLHILINNAGVMCLPYSETKQGFEIQFATNYLSHFLLTRFLLPTLLSTSTSSPPGTVRIINVSSDGHYKLAPKSGINFSDLNLRNSSTWTRYGHSKLCQVLHLKSLAYHYGDKNILAMSLHPGTVKTNLSAGPRGSSSWYKYIQPLVELGAPGPGEGCANIVYCAASPVLTLEDNGCYFLPIGKKAKASKFGEDPALAEELFQWTEKRLSELGY